MYKYNVYWKSFLNNIEYEVGMLTKTDEWVFVYSDEIEDAISNGFQPFLEMPDTKRVYIQNEIFLTFKYRLLDLENPVTLETDNISIVRKGLHKIK